jgi:hypothetical protein
MSPWEESQGEGEDGGDEAAGGPIQEPPPATLLCARCPFCGTVAVASRFAAKSANGSWAETALVRVCPSCRHEAQNRLIRFFPGTKADLVTRATPTCATCGAEPVGTFHDGSPRYGRKPRQDESPDRTYGCHDREK